MSKLLRIFTDGGSRGNPGPAGLGVAAYDEKGTLLKTSKAFLGRKTNNQAEYEALIRALELAGQLHAQCVEIYADSQLLVEQMRGKYKVKNQVLASLFVKAWNLMQHFSSVRFYHIRREKNKVADKLANEAMDEGEKK